MIGVVALQRIKGQQHLTEAAEHNKRTPYAQGKASTKIDHGRSHLNYSLGGCPDPGAIVTKWLQLRNAAGIPTPGRSNEVSAIEFVISLPPGAESVINLRDFFTDSTDFICSMFGGRENLLSSDVHVDQEQPHCHILMMPLVNGKMAGAPLIRSAGQNYSKLHEGFFRQVASRYGLSKPEPKLHGETKEERVGAVLAWLDSLPDDGERWRATQAQTKKLIRRDPRPYEPTSEVLVKPNAGRRLKTFKQIALSQGKGPRTKAAADARDRRMTERGQCTDQSLLSDGEGQERYSLSTMEPEPNGPLPANAIAFPSPRPERRPPDGTPATPSETKGYALYSFSSPLPYSATSRPHCSRYRKAPTSAAVEALMALRVRPTMGTH